MDEPLPEVAPRVRFVGLYRRYASMVFAAVLLGFGAVLLVSFSPVTAQVLFPRIAAILLGFVTLTLPVLIAVDALARLLAASAPIHSRVTLAVTAVPLSLMWAAVWLEAVNVSSLVDDPWPVSFDLIVLLGLGAWVAVAYTIASAKLVTHGDIR